MFQMFIYDAWGATSAPALAGMYTMSHKKVVHQTHDDNFLNS